MKEDKGVEGAITDPASSGSTAWRRIEIARHPKRPRSSEYIGALCKNFFSLHGDRLYGDDPAIITGFAQISSSKVLVVAQEKGCCTESRIKHNFGMVHPEGYRKALRCMRLAEKFSLPIVVFIDTPGAYAGIEAEERGQGVAIAENLAQMFLLEVPIIVVLIGEGCSGGALAIGVGDHVAILEHAYYSVISPEACASILWKSISYKEQAAEALRVQSENLLQLGVVDHIIEEPEGGAHCDRVSVYRAVQKHIEKTLESLASLSTQELLQRRYNKFRSIGADLGALSLHL